MAIVSVRCLSHVGLTVTDLDRSVAFYTEVLGFTVCMESRGDTWSRIGVALDDTMVELFSPHPTGQFDDPVDLMYPAPYGQPKLALTVWDARGAYEALTARGVPTLGPVAETPVSLVCFVLDPDDTQIQLHQFKAGYARVRDMLKDLNPENTPSPGA
jgi:catechol 2,3-dioxygenase-like lactoylglutathione lyase family enzyme